MKRLSQLQRIAPSRRLSPYALLSYVRRNLRTRWPQRQQAEQMTSNWPANAKIPGKGCQQLQPCSALRTARPTPGQRCARRRCAGTKPEPPRTGRANMWKQKQVTVAFHASECLGYGCRRLRCTETCTSMLKGLLETQSADHSTEIEQSTRPQCFICALQ